MRLSLASLTNVSSRSLDSFSLGEKVRMSANRARVGGEIPKSSVALYRRGWMGRDWRGPGAPISMGLQPCQEGVQILNTMVKLWRIFTSKRPAPGRTPTGFSPAKVAVQARVGISYASF